ncbi:MAG: energy-coupling factor transport system permease protein [Mycobacterium sp.]|nr:energy-coupling factor transport system permease protein [Mycobacterium sp.]
MTSAPHKPRRPVVLLRPVPGDSVIHRLWAGTKLLVVFGIGLLLTFYPGWVPIALVGALVLMTAWLAGVPRGALPSVPRWLWFVVLFTGILSVFSGGGPHFTLFGVTTGFGGVLSYLRVMALTIVLLGLSALVSWTTNVADVAPAISRLGRPLKLIRVPVDQWAVAIALALRAFPMLIDEFRVLFAARRLRPRDPAITRRERHRRWSGEVIDLLAAAITVALRRADEMGDAITARGGAGQLSALPSRPKWADTVAFAVLLAVCGLSLYVELATPLATSS